MAGRPSGFDANLYRDRNVVGRAVNRLKSWRGIATRYDKCARNYRTGCTARGTDARVTPSKGRTRERGRRRRVETTVRPMSAALPQHSTRHSPAQGPCSGAALHVSASAPADRDRSGDGSGYADAMSRARLADRTRRLDLEVPARLDRNHSCAGGGRCSPAVACGAISSTFLLVAGAQQGDIGMAWNPRGSDFGDLNPAGARARRRGFRLADLRSDWSLAVAVGSGSAVVLDLSRSSSGR